MNSLLDHRIPPPLVALLCALAAWQFTDATRGSVFDFGPVYILTILLCGKGLFIAIMGMREFARRQTTVNPLTPGSASALVDGGVFRYTRNPMYLGLATALAGIAFALGNWSAFLFVLLFVLYIQLFQIYPEERAMLELFGDEYSNYCAKVRRWL